MLQVQPNPGGEVDLPACSTSGAFRILQVTIVICPKLSKASDTSMHNTFEAKQCRRRTEVELDYVHDDLRLRAIDMQPPPCATTPCRTRATYLGAVSSKVANKEKRMSVSCNRSLKQCSTKVLRSTVLHPGRGRVNATTALHKQPSAGNRSRVSHMQSESKT
ncbi:hypothetical protein BD413DRAFT_39962 [Trametes elegans]|nr:hypothetical protein BD413DRAFT_39962 [Trametes elegans]